MKLRPEQVLTELRFDANALEISMATVDGEAMAWRTEGRSLVFAFPHAMEPGTPVTLRLVYAGKPARGLEWEDNGFYTSYFTCDWMLCALDRPGDAFTFRVDLRLGDAGWREIRAERSRAYPAHVQGFAAGRWNVARQSRGAMKFIFASGHASEADLAAMFADTPAMQAFFTRRAGVPFPHATFTQLLVRGAAAQEGAGFAILGDDVVRPVLTDPHEDWAAAHEMAHSYWGNLISPTTSDAFLAQRRIDHLHGRGVEAATLGRGGVRRAKSRWRRSAGRGRAMPAGIVRWLSPAPILISGRDARSSIPRACCSSSNCAANWARTPSGAASPRTRAQTLAGRWKARTCSAPWRQASGRNLAALFRGWVYYPR